MTFSAHKPGLSITDTKTTTPYPLTLEANTTALNLNVDMDSGLTTANAAKRLEQYGRMNWNQRHLFQRGRNPIAALVYLLIAATAISMIAMVH